MKSSRTRRPLQQQAATEQKGPFFPKAKEETAKKDDVFFQAKLAVGGQNDKHEQEADGMADKVQRKGEDKDKESDKGAAGQGIAADKDKAADKGSAGQAPGADKDKTPGSKGAAGAADKDKAPDKGTGQAAAGAQDKDKAPAAQQKDKAPDKGAGQAAAGAQNKDKPEKGAAGPTAGGKDKEPDKSAAPAAGKEEDKKVSRKAENDKEPETQKMSDADKKEEGETKVNKKEESGKDTVTEPMQVMREEAPAQAPAQVRPGGHKASLEERIRKSKGKGQPLSEEVRAFLETELGADFSEVVIHTDGDAVAMSKELNALAFTNGFDIYFNAGQYRPDTLTGQKLLAHELTHVIQQTGVSKKTKQKK